MWLPELPILEKIIRAAAVYVFLMVAIRMTGRRQFGQMTPFDIVVLLMISNVVQNAMIGNDNSVLGGFTGAATILALNYLVARVTISSKKFERVIEGSPTTLIHNGKVIDKNLRAEMITHGELMAALRSEGILSPDEVHIALLEDSGKITAIRRQHAPEKPAANERE